MAWKVKAWAISAVVTLFCVQNVDAQRAKDGNLTVTAANTIVNTYTALTVDAFSGNTSITVANNAMTGGVFGGALAPGDLILIYQAQGATLDINTWPTIGWGGDYTVPQDYFDGTWGANPQFWGQVTNYGNAGFYERAEVQSVSGGGVITLQCGLQRNYSVSGHVQVVRIPRFDDLTVNAGASITPPLWDGQTGGIVALEVENTLTVNGTIDVSEAGFRGGELDPDSETATTDPTEVRHLGSNNFMQGSEKGEGIGGYHAEYDARDSRYGIGAAANGGGGGGYQNTGGGGGANVQIGTYTGKGNPKGYVATWNLEQPGFGGSTSPGGGRGGYAFSENNANELTTGPNDNAWGGDGRKNNGGFGGHPLPFDVARVFFGGGGGSGDQDSDEGGAGGRGGGIIFLTSYGTITGNGAFDAHGQDGQNSNPNGLAPSGGSPRRGIDGAGGGGAGGSIHFENAAPVPGSITLDVHGGDGGDQDISILNVAPLPPLSTEAGGPGGSGAGGYIAYTSGAPTKNLLAGVAGTTNSSHMVNFPPNGATEGSNALNNLPTISFYDIQGTDVDICANNTASLTVSTIGSFPGGATVEWYTQPFGGTSVNSGLSYTTPTLATTTTYYVGACPGTFRIPVTVNILPAEDASFATSPLCDGGTATVSGVTGGTFSFNTAPSDGAVIDPATGTVSGGTPGGTYSIQYTTGGGCPGTSIEPLVASLADDPTFTTTATCDGGTASVSGTTGGTFSFNTAPSDAAVIDPATGTVTGGTPGASYDIQYATSGVCAANSTQMVVALNQEDATFATTATCDGGTASVSGTTGGTFSFNTAPSDAAVIDPATGAVTGGTSGASYDILYTTSGTCFDTEVQSVVALTQDDATFSATGTCGGATASVSGTTGGTFSFNTAPSDAAVIDPATGTVTGGTSGTSYDILYTTGGACVATQVQSVVALTQDDATFATTATCDGGTASVSGTTGGMFSFNTPPADAAVIDPVTGAVTGGTPNTNYDIMYATSGACAANSTVTLTSLSLDDPSYTISTQCDGGLMTVTGTTGGTFSFNTAPSDGAVIDPTTGAVTGGTPATNYDINYTTGGACPANLVQTLTTNSADNPAFATTATCDGGTASVSGTLGGTFSFNVAPSDAAVIDPVTGTVTGGTPGASYDISYGTTGACAASSTQMVTALTQDDATFATTATCDGGTASVSGLTGGTFSFNTAPSDAAVIDPATGAVTGGTSGASYDVLYTTNGACPATQVQSVVALTQDDATFGTTATCDGGTASVSGLTGGTFSFNVAPSDAAVIDPATGTVTGGTSGASYDILYTTNGTCVNTEVQSVTVLTQDDATFATTATCDGGTASISGTTGGTFSFNTAPSDAAVIDPATGTVSGGTSGASYDVLYTTNGSCPQNMTQTVVALTQDDATFATTATCDGGTASVSGTTGGTFSFNTAPSDAAVIDPTTGTVSGGTSGVSYDVLYTTSGVCPSNSMQSVIALSQDDPSFTTSPECDGGTVNVSGLTGGTFSFNVAPSDAAVIDATTGTVSGGTSGATYDILYTTNGTCPATQVQSVTASLTDNPTFVTTPSCDGGTVSVTGTAGGTFSFDVAPADGATIDPVTGTVSGGTSGATYAIQYATTGSCAASSVENVTVIVTPQIDPVMDVESCDQYTLGDVMNINGTDLTGNVAYYDNSQAMGGMPITGALTTTQTVYIYDDNTGCSDEESFTVTINTTDDPSFSLTDFCEGQSNQAVVSGTSGGSFNFDTAVADGATIDAATGELTNSVGGTSYTIEYVTSGVCPDSSTQLVQVFAIPAAPSVTADQNYCSNETVQMMEATGTGGTLTWYDDASLNNPIGSGNNQNPDSFNGTHSYYVAETQNGCEGPASSIVITIEDCDIIVPTAFTPDNDGANDTWELMNIDNIYPRNTVRIYNRWGNLLFQSEEGNYDGNRWDGTYQGEALPVGSYYYIIDLNDGESESKSGSVSIILN